MQITLHVQRFDPRTDPQPYSQPYIVDWQHHETVLDLLLRVRREDPSLSFRRSCRSSICGSCAIAIAGRTRLACQTLVREVAEEGGSLTIAPMPGFRQIKDLVVDMDPFFEALKRVLPWVITVPHHDGRVAADHSQRIDPPATCILCGICDAEIPQNGAVTPAAMVKNVRMAVDPRDALGSRRINITGLSEEGIRAFRELLAAVCPKGIRLPSVAVE